MEGSGGFVSNGLPGVRGPEGKQVSKLLKKGVKSYRALVRKLFHIKAS